MRIAWLTVLLAACSSSSPPDLGSDLGVCNGGPVAGPADAHCTASTTVNSAECAVDAGTTAFGATMFGSEGDDDDCKYHVSFFVEPICEGSPGAVFVVTVTNRSDGSAVTGANTRAEATIGDHAATSLGISDENAPGVYRVGPVVFDEPGQWTLRFHMFEFCGDTPTSPHGHAAFFINI